MALRGGSHSTWCFQGHPCCGVNRGFSPFRDWVMFDRWVGHVLSGCSSVHRHGAAPASSDRCESHCRDLVCKSIWTCLALPSVCTWEWTCWATRPFHGHLRRNCQMVPPAVRVLTFPTAWPAPALACLAPAAQRGPWSGVPFRGRTMPCILQWAAVPTWGAGLLASSGELGSATGPLTERCSLGHCEPWSRHCGL